MDIGASASIRVCRHPAAVILWDLSCCNKLVTKDTNTLLLLLLLLPAGVVVVVFLVGEGDDDEAAAVSAALVLLFVVYPSWASSAATSGRSYPIPALICDPNAAADAVILASFVAVVEVPPPDVDVVVVPLPPLRMDARAWDSLVESTSAGIEPITVVADDDDGFFLGATFPEGSKR